MIDLFSSRLKTAATAALLGALACAPGAAFRVKNSEAVPRPETTVATKSGGAAATLPQRRKKPLRTVLDNGLTVILDEEHSAPVVAFQMWVKVGSADETPTEAGLAHVHEHMLFKGTEKRGVGEIAKTVESNGGDINAWTSFDQTVYHLVMPSREFGVGLDIISDAVQRSTFDQSELKKEEVVVLEELKRSKDMPSHVVSEELFKTAFSKHTYFRPIIGYESTVKAFTRDQILGFYRRWYVPNNMALIAVGDFKTDDALAKVRAAFKDFAPGAVESKREAEPAQKEMRASVVRNNVKEAHVNFAFHIPALHHADVPALDVLSVLLGQGESSRLNVEVKRGRQVVNEAYAYAYTPRDPGLLLTGASFPAKNWRAALAASVEEAVRPAFEEVTGDELAKAKTILESDAVYQKETVQGRARKLGFFETVAGDLDYEEKYLARVRALTPADLRAVAARYFRAENMSVALLLPEEFKATVSSKDVVDTANESFRALTRRYSVLEATAGHGGIVKTTLANGVTLLVKEDHHVPMVAMRAVAAGGLRSESEKTNGVSNLVGALLTKGTASRSAAQIAREIDSMAGALGGFAGKNSIGLRGEFLAKTLEAALELFADCLLRPTFEGAELERERRLVLEELRNQEDSLASLAFKTFAKLHYKAHPYRMDMLGTGKTVSEFKVADLVEHYRRTFVGENVIVSIVGDFEAARVLRLASRLFGVVPKGAGAKIDVPKDSAPTKRETAHVWKEKEQAHIVLGFRGATVKSEDRFALEVLATILAGQGGRLFLELRDKKSLAYSVTASSVEGVEPGTFTLYMGTSPGRLDEAMAGLEGEVRRIVEQPVLRAELERAKRYLVGSHDVSLQRVGTVASSMAFSEAYGLGYDEYLRFPAAISAVTADDVARVAKKYLNLDRATVAMVRPKLAKGLEKSHEKTKAVAPNEKDAPREKVSEKAKVSAKPKGKVKPKAKPTKGKKKKKGK
ncbi:MAG: insulinase family protein [Deltaproteobacteria bacterium]|nr:insulinase family protein [Deltaproteobacteria bacterium]